MVRLAKAVLIVVALSFVTSVESARAQATISSKCKDGSVVTVSTGNGSGECSTSGVTGCKDGNGNMATGGCSTSGAQCLESKGSGSCQIQAAPPATPTTGKGQPGKVAKPISGTKPVQRQ